MAQAKPVQQGCTIQAAYLLQIANTIQAVNNCPTTPQATKQETTHGLVRALDAAEASYYRQYPDAKYPYTTVLRVPPPPSVQAARRAQFLQDGTV